MEGEQWPNSRRLKEEPVNSSYCAVVHVFWGRFPPHLIGLVTVTSYALLTFEISDFTGHGFIAIPATTDACAEHGDVTAREAKRGVFDFDDAFFDGETADSAPGETIR